GVLNIESTQPHSFNPAYVGVLQTEAAYLAADLFILSQGDAKRARFLWHPDAHEWSIRAFLNRLSFALATSLEPSGTQPVLSCTFWHVDHPKGALYVRGTTRFDYEYIAMRSLPLDRSLLGKVSKAK